MSRKIQFAEGEYYHLYNRGVERRPVFENDSDRKRFMLLLYLCNGKAPFRFDRLPAWKDETSLELIKSALGEKMDSPIIAIGAYCLMPNHFHLLVRETTENGISAFMHRLSTAYTMYFNIGRKRDGVLFQGRFKAKHAKTDTYLRYLFSYIHLNPVKIIEPKWKENGIRDRRRAKQYLAEYPYSSYFDYLGISRQFSKLLNQKEFPGYFPEKTTFNREISDWLRYADEAQPRRG
ncbi:MAG: Transposase [Parcubacteria group bacterium GW2011_GWA2_49_9]|nr:MAG: Transposase [Parcubacteria group bacterium GW2011_GWA2_49_9]